MSETSIDAPYLERMDFDGRSFLVFQSSTGGYGLLGDDLRPVIRGRQLIEPIGLGAGGVDPIYWIATA